MKRKLRKFPLLFFTSPKPFVTKGERRHLAVTNCDFKWRIFEVPIWHLKIGTWGKEIIDNKEVYHFGASLKDLGKKWFAFSKFDKEVFRLLDKLGLK